MGFESVVSGKGKVRVGAHFDERVEERRLHELVRCEEAVRARQGDGGLELGEDLVRIRVKVRARVGVRVRVGVRARVRAGVRAIVRLRLGLGSG